MHGPRRAHVVLWTAALAALGGAILSAAEVMERPFLGVTHITRTETSPRSLTMHIIRIDLTAPGIAFRLTGPGGSRETVRQTTLEFLRQEHAQIAVNAHYFLPFPSSETDAWLIGLAASDGTVYSGFETPVQSYAIVPEAPALNLDPSNHAAIVHNDTRFSDGLHVREPVVLHNAVAGSAQILTGGVVTIPAYKDASNLSGLLTPGGPGKYANSHSWYDLLHARTAIGLSSDRRTLLLFTVDRAGGSLGMSVREVADLLLRDYGVSDALNLDGGGSTALAMEDPPGRGGRVVNVPSDNPGGRAVGSNLAVFARRAP